jgi:hypothetical protein
MDLCLIPFGDVHPHPKEGWAAPKGIKHVPFGDAFLNKSIFLLIFTHKFCQRAIFMFSNYLKAFYE